MVVGRKRAFVVRVDEEVDRLDRVAGLDPAAEPVLGVDEDVGSLAARHRRRDLVGEGVVGDGQRRRP